MAIPLKLGACGWGGWQQEGTVRASFLPDACSSFELLPGGPSQRSKAQAQRIEQEQCPRGFLE